MSADEKELTLRHTERDQLLEHGLSLYCTSISSTTYVDCLDFAQYLKTYAVDIAEEESFTAGTES